MVALIGPRQCGKTTLARQIVPPDSTNYFDLEDPLSLAILAEPMAALAHLRGVVVIDEVQRRPDLFPVLRVLADRRPLPVRFLILGSALPNLLQQSTESLAGRLEVISLSGSPEGVFRLSRARVATVLKLTSRVQTLENAHVFPALLRKSHLAKLSQESDFEGIARDVASLPIGFGLDGKSVLKDARSVVAMLERLGIRRDSVTLWGAGLLSGSSSLSTTSPTIQDSAFLIKHVVYDGDIDHDLSKPDGVPKKLLELTRMKALGWEPKTTLGEGIRKTTTGVGRGFLAGRP